MRKIVTLALSLIVVVFLAACGSKGESDPIKSGKDNTKTGEDTPLTRTDDTNNENNSGDDDKTTGGDVFDPFGELDSDIPIVGDLTDDVKKEMEKALKESGGEVKYNPDGSTTFTDEEGNEVTQNPDGSWSVKDENGEAVGSLGGSWPENEFTKQVPEPPFAMTYSLLENGTFTAAFSMDVGEFKEYVEKIKNAGFTIDAETQDEDIMGMFVYFFSAKNNKGYSIEAYAQAGICGLTITK